MGTDDRRRRRAVRGGDDRGQTSAEYVAVLVLLGAVMVGVVVGGGSSQLSAAVADGLCRAFGGVSCGAVTTAAAGDEDRSARLIAAEQARAPFVNRHGGRLAALDQVGRAAREAGALDRAERIAAQLALYERLAGSGPRAPLLEPLYASDDAVFAALVGDRTVYVDGGRFNVRWFQTDAVPGEGVVAFDYFIAASRSEFLAGDDRDFADPLTLAMDDSRVFIVIDRESGRGAILQTETCTVSVVGASFCNEPRPIARNREGAIANDRDNDVTGEGINFDLTNQYDVTADAAGIELTYDALNSITAPGISIDGTIRLEPDGTGGFVIVTDTRDDYPSRGIYQYVADRAVVVIDEDGERSVWCGALPVRLPGC